MTEPYRHCVCGHTNLVHNWDRVCDHDTCKCRNYQRCDCTAEPPEPHLKGN